MHKKICENNNIYVKYAKIIIYKKTKVCYYQGIERRKRGKEMLQTIENVNAAVNNFVWGVPAIDRKSTRLNSSHSAKSRMPSSA